MKNIKWKMQHEITECFLLCYSGAAQFLIVIMIGLYSYITYD